MNGAVSQIGWKAIRSVFLHSPLILIAGCIPLGETPPQLVGVQGKVLLDGNPVQDARVVFVPLASGTGSSDFVMTYGTTDSYGGFQLATRDGKPGASPGVNLVLISKTSHSESEISPEIRLSAASAIDDLSSGLLNDSEDETVPFYYNSSSDLERNVVPGSDNEMVFELSSIDPMLTTVQKGE